MPLAITLRFDPDSAASIGRLWDALAEAGIDRDRQALGYSAHVTLAIYPDEASVSMLVAAVERVARLWTPIPITMFGFGVFPGPPAILFAAPVTTPALLDRQKVLTDALSDLSVHPHYQRNRWVPHVTLSGPLRDAGIALAALLPLWQQVAGRLDRVDIVRFRPVEVLRSWSLDSPIRSSTVAAP